jgi:dihydroorotate dehydrogenase (NAD+) catalytic subunit
VRRIAGGGGKAVTASDQPGRACTDGPDLAVRLGPLRLDYPLINASGTMEIIDLANAFGPRILQDPPLAAYVAKTITLGSRAGNPPPRILETSGGMINAIGLEGEGLDGFLRERLPLLRALPRPLIVSIAGFSVQEYVLLAEGLRRALEEGDRAAGGRPERADDDRQGDAAVWTQRVGLELNISCPNVHSGCASIGADAVETEQVVAAVRSVWPGLLIAKLTPNVTDIVTVGRAAVEGGADALAAVNTFKGLVIDRRSLRPYLGNVTGGLSGPAIKPLALRCIYELFEAVEVPIIGMGGVVGAEDVLDFLACGARVVALGSGLFRDPCSIPRLAPDLRVLLRTRGLSLDEAVGIAHHPLD